MEEEVDFQPSPHLALVLEDTTCDGGAEVVSSQPMISQRVTSKEKAKEKIVDVDKFLGIKMDFLKDSGKIKPLSIDFSYLDDKNLEMMNLLNMAKNGFACNFKVAKWVLIEFNKVNIKMRSLKEKFENTPKGAVFYILIERIVDLESSISNFIAECENYLQGLESKVAKLDKDIQKIL